MKRPRLADRDKLVEELRAQVQWVRHAWELGRMQRRAIADLQHIVKRNVHYSVALLRAGDPRVARAQVDRHLQETLKRNGRFDERGLIYGGETLVAHRPLITETLDIMRTRLRALEDTLAFARFASSLEQVAFRLIPKDA